MFSNSSHGSLYFAAAALTVIAAPANSQVDVSKFDTDKYQCFLTRWDATKSRVFFTVIHSQDEFKAVFKPAAINGHNKPFAPDAAFFDKKLILVAANIAGDASLTDHYTLKSAVEKGNTLTLNFTYKEAPHVPDSAQYTSIFAVSVPRKGYKLVKFVENGKQVGVWKP